MNVRIISSATGLALVFAATAAIAATPIGTTAISTNQDNGKIGAQERALKRGDAIHQNEQIKTGPASNAQLLFRDETSMTLNANTEIVLDKLVFDPNKKTGEVVVRALSGGFRFVSGSLDSNAYKIKTPVGTIGVRGTIFNCDLGIASLFCNVLQGRIDFCGLGGDCATIPAGGTLLSNGYSTRAGQNCGGQGCSNANNANNSLQDQILNRRALPPSQPVRVFVR